MDANDLLTYVTLIDKASALFRSSSDDVNEREKFIRNAVIQGCAYAKMPGVANLISKHESQSLSQIALLATQDPALMAEMSDALRDKTKQAGDDLLVVRCRQCGSIQDVELA